MDYLGAYSKEFREYYETAVQIIVSNKRLYEELKTLLDEVVFGVVDIDDYFDKAEEVAEVIGKLINDYKSEQTLFHSFLLGIDPEQGGSVDSFRTLCRMLLEKIKFFNQYRQKKIPITVVINNDIVSVVMAKRKVERKFHVVK